MNLLREMMSGREARERRKEVRISTSRAVGAVVEDMEGKEVGV